MQYWIQERWSTPLCNLCCVVSHFARRVSASACFSASFHRHDTLWLHKNKTEKSRSWPALAWTDCDSLRKHKCTFTIHTCTSSRTELWQLRQTGLLIQQALWGLWDHCHDDHNIMVLDATSPHLLAVTEQAGRNRALHYKTRRPLLDHTK